MKDIRQSNEYSNYLQSQGWRVVCLNGINNYIKVFPLLGAFMKVQRPLTIGRTWLGSLDELAREYRVFSVVIEPNNEKQSQLLKRLNYRITNPYLPTKTIRLLLSRRENTILGQMAKDARYSIKKTASLSYHNTSDLSAFRKAWKRSVNYQRYVPSLSNMKSLKESFRDNSLFLGSHNNAGKIISGGIFLFSEEIAYYWQGFSSREGRSSLAQYGVIWHGIRWAKKRGAKFMDFEGIYDERFPNRKWKGFSHFKKSFGGEIVEYPGAFKKSRLPFV